MQETNNITAPASYSVHFTYKAKCQNPGPKPRQKTLAPKTSDWPSQPTSATRTKEGLLTFTPGVKLTPRGSKMPQSWNRYLLIGGQTSNRFLIGQWEYQTPWVCVVVLLQSSEIRQSGGRGDDLLFWTSFWTLKPPSEPEGMKLINRVIYKTPDPFLYLGPGACTRSFRTPLQ